MYTKQRLDFVASSKVAELCSIFYFRITCIIFNVLCWQAAVQGLHIHLGIQRLRVQLAPDARLFTVNDVMV